MTQPIITSIVTDLCGKRVYVTRTRWEKYVSWTEVAHEGVVHAVSYVHGGYGGYVFLIAVERDVTAPDGTTKKAQTLEAYQLGDGVGIVLVDGAEPT